MWLSHILKVSNIYLFIYSFFELYNPRFLSVCFQKLQQIIMHKYAQRIGMPSFTLHEFRYIELKIIRFNRELLSQHIYLDVNITKLHLACWKNILGNVQNFWRCCIILIWLHVIIDMLHVYLACRHIWQKNNLIAHMGQNPHEALLTSR